MASYKKIINMQKKKAKIFLQKHYECNSTSSQNKLSMAHDSKELPTNHPHQQATSNERSKVSASHGGFPRPPWRSVKKNRAFPVKNEKMFERSEFFSFREMPDFLALER